MGKEYQSYSKVRKFLKERGYSVDKDTGTLLDVSTVVAFDFDFAYNGKHVLSFVLDGKTHEMRLSDSRLDLSGNYDEISAGELVDIVKKTRETVGDVREFLNVVNEDERSRYDVVVYLYGRYEIYKDEENAKRIFLNYLHYAEDSSRDRYYKILQSLLYGEKIVSDGCFTSENEKHFFERIKKFSVQKAIKIIEKSGYEYDFYE